MGDISIQPIVRAQSDPVVSLDAIGVERKASLPVESARFQDSTGEKAEEKASPTPVLTPDVQLKFQVDDQTHEVTVLVLDRTSQRVVRTIPAEEIRKFRQGDLLELFA